MNDQLWHGNHHLDNSGCFVRNLLNLDIPGLARVYLHFEWLIDNNIYLGFDVVNIVRNNALSAQHTYSWVSEIRIFFPWVNFRKLSYFKYWAMICKAITFLWNHFVLKSLTHLPLWDVDTILKVLARFIKLAIFKHNPVTPILHLSNEITFWWMPENLSDKSILAKVMAWYLCTTQE